jgi:hypothetical protein
MTEEKIIERFEENEESIKKYSKRKRQTKTGLTAPANFGG